MPEMSINDIKIHNCQGCSLPIKDQYIYKVLPDMQWHENCLKCTECSCVLNSTCFINGTKVYCRQDYAKIFNTNNSISQNNISNNIRSCDKCNQILKSNDFVMKSKEKIFHMDCFKCNICQKKLAPGDEYCHNIENDINMLFCKEDALIGNNMHINRNLSPKFLNHTNNQLYLSTSARFPTPENSSSSICSFSPSTTSSSSSSCSINDSPINNYNQNSSFQNISQNLSYNPNNGLRMNQFNEFENLSDKQGLNSNSESDDEDETKIDNEIDEDDLSENNESLTDEDSSFTECPKKLNKVKKMGQKMGRKSFQSSPDSLLMQINQNYTQNCHNTSQGSNNGSKPARIRTVLNEKQLHTLRACYGANPRPDALMKEQMVEMTGLNPRVIRVWFQNKRCKDKKKNMLRPMSEHGHILNPHINSHFPIAHNVQNYQNFNNNNLMFNDQCNF